MPKVEAEIVVQAPVDVVYQAWHNFENFPKFMDNVEDVRIVGHRRWHWKARGPLGVDAEWDAEMTLDRPNRAIGWRSLEGAYAVSAQGCVEFQPSGDATILEVVLEYDARTDDARDTVTHIFSDAEDRIEADLERFKDAIERGRDRSGLTFADDPGVVLAEPTGATAGQDSERIHPTNSGIAPADVDDPDLRAYTGQDFGYTARGLPDV